MRYYTIIITDPVTGKVAANPVSGSLYQWSSLAPNGRTLPGALNIELDVIDSAFATPSGTAFIRVWGIALADISQSGNLAGLNITVYAGFAAGLPLANPAQAGIIAQGIIIQCLGNWVGLDMTLDLFFAASTGSVANPANVILNWPAGQPLAAAIANTLRTAFPAYKQVISVSPRLVKGSTETGAYSSLVEFAQFIRGKSQAMIGGDYPGVDITVSHTTFTVSDGTTPTTPKAIQFYELIGQPTWIEPSTLQFKCPMRADVQMGSYITLPPGLITTTQGSHIGVIGSSRKDRTSFSGTYQIALVRHVGNFRQAGADAWVTTFNAAPQMAGDTPGLSSNF